MNIWSGRLCSGSADNSIMLWDTNQITAVMTLTGHARYVSCVIQLSDGRVCSSSGDGSLMVWDISGTGTGAS